MYRVDCLYGSLVSCISVLDYLFVLLSLYSLVNCLLSYSLSNLFFGISVPLPANSSFLQLYLFICSLYHLKSIPLYSFSSVYLFFWLILILSVHQCLSFTACLIDFLLSNPFFFSTDNFHSFFYIFPLSIYSSVYLSYTFLRLFVCCHFRVLYCSDHLFGSMSVPGKWHNRVLYSEKISLKHGSSPVWPEKSPNVYQSCPKMISLEKL